MFSARSSAFAKPNPPNFRLSGYQDPSGQPESTRVLQGHSTGRVLKNLCDEIFILLRTRQLFAPRVSSNVEVTPFRNGLTLGAELGDEDTLI